MRQPRKRYAPRLADDGLPREMFQDVLRASHRWLVNHDTDYRAECLHIEAYTTRYRITPKVWRSRLQDSRNNNQPNSGHQ